MIITVVVSVCHALSTVPQPVCREEIITRAEMPMQSCMISQPALADWKARSIFAGDQWTIARIRCVPGDYVVKDRV